MVLMQELVFTNWIQPSACNPIMDLDKLVDWLKRLYEVLVRQSGKKKARHASNSLHIYSCLFPQNGSSARISCRLFS